MREKSKEGQDDDRTDHRCSDSQVHGAVYIKKKKKSIYKPKFSRTTKAEKKSVKLLLGGGAFCKRVGVNINTPRSSRGRGGLFGGGNWPF